MIVQAHSLEDEEERALSDKGERISRQILIIEVKREIGT